LTPSDCAGAIIVAKSQFQNRIEIFSLLLDVLLILTVSLKLSVGAPAFVIDSFFVRPA
jgi:hypothetical protein